MKNRIFIRILLVIEVLAAMAIAVCVFIASWGGISIFGTAEWLTKICSYTGNQILITIICAAVVLIGFILMFARFTAKPVSSHILRDGDYGTISVSTVALEEISRRYFNEIKDIRSVKLNVLPDKGGIEVKVSIAVAPNINIPQLTASIQEGLKTHIETHTGIIVVRTRILVFDTTIPTR